jgi:NAD(P)-dependent dehydrogenase (short-subunit alcohol dehydrogenase family)
MAYRRQRQQKSLTQGEYRAHTGEERAMKDFTGKIAVVTGAGTGMGRELARLLAAEGCNVAMCDIIERNMEETRRLIEADRPPQGTRVTTHLADVGIEQQILKFRDEVAEEMDTDKIHLLFNNAGVGGGGSLFTQSRAEWDRTFNICWGGVYWGTRAFLPMLVKANEAHIINTSSVNGFWASIGPTSPHTAYSAAKFAVKGFTEALMTDLKVNAPHVKCSVVMPGHIGTDIVINSRKVLHEDPDQAFTHADIRGARFRMKAAGMDESQMSDEQVTAVIQGMGEAFRDNAPTSAAQAAKIILDGVREEKWRILVGDDAHVLDERVRGAPEKAYDADFFQLFAPGVARR